MRFCRGGLALVFVGVSLLLTPLAADAQKSAKAPTLGILSPHPAPTPEQLTGGNPVLDKLRELGWIESQTIVLERAYGEGREDRLPALAAELVRKRVDVIWALGPEAALAAARATTTIPIVFWGVGYPVEMGLVDSLRRPGRNVTGMGFYTGAELATKHLEFLREIAPGVTRLAWITVPGGRRTLAGDEYRNEVFEGAARRLRLELQIYPVWQQEDFDAVFARILEWRAQAFGAVPAALTVRERRRMVDFANRNRLPSVFGMKDFPEVGGLLSYGADWRETMRQSVVYVDKILKGAKPADLPVEQPTKFELVINLKTAKALGLTIPQSLLLRADQVIE